MKKIFVKILIVLLFFISSCADNDDANDENSTTDLIGSWSKTRNQGDGLTISTYTFEGDFTYEFESESFGYNGKPITELTGSSEIHGTFKVEVDSLIFRTSSSGFLKSKFWIENNVLHLEYISYPADAPVLTKMEYNKVD
jgi:hypothetical protein